MKVVQRAEQGQRRITLGEAAAIAWSLGRSIDELVKFAETATFEPPKRGRNRFLIDPEPMLPTYGYRILCHNATLIDLEAEGMWPTNTSRVHRHDAGHRFAVASGGAAMPAADVA